MSKYAELRAHTTIQAAVSDAVSGDSILIAAGRYAENITIEDKQLTLQGALGGTSGVTEVDAAGRGPVFVLGSGVAGATPELIEIHNLVIAQGHHTGGTGVGGGVQVRAGAYLHIFDSTISRNIASVGGGIGVNTPNAPQTTITNCLISENLALPDPTVINAVADMTRGGGVAVAAGSVSIQESTVSRNQATGNGAGGICVTSTSNANVFTLNNVYIVENLAGGGLVTTDGVVLKLSNTTIRDNVGGNCLGPACPP